MKQERPLYVTLMRMNVSAFLLNLSKAARFPSMSIAVDNSTNKNSTQEFTINKKRDLCLSKNPF